MSLTHPPSHASKAEEGCVSHRDSWHPRHQNAVWKKRTLVSKVQSFSQGGAWDRTGNSKVRFILEKMSGTHICSERREDQSILGLDRSPLPQGPGNGPSTCPTALACSLSPGPKALGSDQGLQQGPSQQEQRLRLCKAEDQKVLAAAFHIWEGRRSQAGKRLRKSPRKPGTCP